MKFTKEDARKRVLNCAKQYQQNLLHKKLLIIFRERQDNSIRFIEVIFHERNYQHLTGLELTNTEGKILQHQSKNFYRKCIENKLGLNEFQFKSDGTSHLKLAALPVLMDVTKITKITGDYNNLRPYLFVDKVMGGINFCLGLSRENDVFVPSSALLEDIKKLTASPSQVLAIFEKDIDSELYSTVKHVAKGLNLHAGSRTTNRHHCFFHFGAERKLFQVQTTAQAFDTDFVFRNAQFAICARHKPRRGEFRQGGRKAELFSGHICL